MAEKKQKKPKKKKVQKKQQDKPLEWKSLEKLPTKRQHETFKNLEATGFDLNQLEKCATDAGYPAQYAKRIGVRAIIAHADNPAVIEALEKHNITVDRTIKKVSQIMDAKHPNPGYGGVADSPTQLKATQYAGQLLDLSPSKKIDITGNIKSQHEIKISFETIERMKKADAMIEGDIIDAEVV